MQVMLALARALARITRIVTGCNSSLGSVARPITCVSTEYKRNWQAQPLSRIPPHADKVHAIGSCTNSVWIFRMLVFGNASDYANLVSVQATLAAGALGDISRFARITRIGTRSQLILVRAFRLRVSNQTTSETGNRGWMRNPRRMTRVRTRRRPAVPASSAIRPPRGDRRPCRRGRASPPGRRSRPALQKSPANALIYNSFPKIMQPTIERPSQRTYREHGHRPAGRFANLSRMQAARSRPADVPPAAPRGSRRALN
jgi:hypothetical protein